MKLVEVLLAGVIGTAVIASAMKVLSVVGPKSARTRIVAVQEVESSAARQRITEMLKSAQRVELYSSRQAVTEGTATLSGEGACAVIWSANASGDVEAWTLSLDPPADDDQEWRTKVGAGRIRLVSPAGTTETLVAIAQPPDGVSFLAWEDGLVRARWMVDYSASGSEVMQLERINYSAYGMPYRMR